LFFLGYFAKANVSLAINTGRDADFWKNEFNPGDILLGNVAALDGAYFSRPIRSPSPIDVASWIGELSP
jgi:hypothetical protein